jgi:hypothetical protein
MNTLRTALFFLLALPAFAQSYSLPQLPRLTNASGDSSLLLVWDGTNVYAITPNNLGTLITASKLSTTNGTANGLTVIGALTTTGSSGPLYNDPATSKIGFGGVASAPMDFWVNLMKFGANDGASTIRARSNGTDKDLIFIAPDRAGGEAGFLRFSAATAANTLKIGGGPSGYKMATTVQFAAGSSVSDTTGATVLSYTATGITASQLLTALLGVVSSNLTVTGSIDTTSSSGPLYVNPSASKIGFGGAASQPFEFYANIMRFGANDGNATNRLRTANTDQDISFTAPDYAASTAVGFLRMSPTISANTMLIGAGQGGYKAATSVRFATAPSVSSTSPVNHGSINLSGQWTIGGVTPTGTAKLTITSTTGGIVPPQISGTSWDGFTKSQGEFGYDTTVNKITTYDGTTRRHLAEELTGNVVWDIPSITAGTEQTTTLTVTGAATGDQVLVDFPRPAANVLLVGQVTAANTVTLYAMATGATVDPASRTFYVTVKRR